MRNLEYLDERFKEDPSENIDFLFAPGKIEELVAEGRAPVKIGMIGSVGEEMKPYYQVPPRSFDPSHVGCVYAGAGGALVFVYRDGSQHVGSTFTLTHEQARLLEERKNLALMRPSLTTPE